MFTIKNLFSYIKSKSSQLKHPQIKANNTQEEKEIFTSFMCFLFSFLGLSTVLGTQ